MATKNNQRTRLTKMLLRESLIDLMHKKSVNKITIKEICEQAQLNRSTFYLHYADQFALLDDIKQEMIEKTKEFLDNIDSKIDSISYIITLLDYIKENGDIFKMLFCQQENASFQTLFLDNTMKHIRESMFHSCPAKLSNYVYCFILQGCSHMIQEWINSDFDISSQELAKLVFQLSDKSMTLFEK